jgi:DNA-binding transcriptional regulator YiaG
MHLSVLSEDTEFATPGECIRKARIQGRLRWKDLATLVGVHQATVKTWEGSIKYAHRQQWDINGSGQ